MAVENSSRGMDQLDARLGRRAGAWSMIACLLAVGLTVYTMIATDLPAWMLAGAVVKILLLLVLIGVGAWLFRGEIHAQRILLVFWLLALLVSVIVGLASILRGTPEVLAEYWPFHPAMILIASVAISSVSVVLLIRTASSSSRLRYASMVSVSVAAAIAAAMAINIIAQTDYARRSVETLGRFTISDRTRAILRDLDKPVILTCVYTGTDEKTRSEYRPRVVELLEEMRELQAKIDVRQVDDDDDKAELLARLREHLGGRAGSHDMFLRKFVRTAPQVAREIEAAEQQWAGPLPYLALWGQPTILRDDLNKLATKLARAGQTVERELQGPSLPKYDKLVTDAKEALTEARKALQAHANLLERMSKIPPKVKAGRKDALASLDQCVAALKAMAAAVGKEGDPKPADPSAVLKKFVTAARKAADQAMDTAGVLANIAGEDNAELLAGSAPWFEQESVRIGGRQVRVRLSHGQRFGMIAQEVDRAAREAETVQKRANVETQAQAALNLRKSAAWYVDSITQARAKVDAAMTKLATVDPASQKVLAAAGDGTCFDTLLAPVRDLLNEVETLPEIKGDTLAGEISDEKNFVLIEAGEGEKKAVEMVGFDEVWPLKVAPMGMLSGPEDEARRTFNGDSAVGSKLLTMTREAFATVFLAHVPGPPPHPYFGGGSRFGPESFSALREQLEKANFKVELWDLNNEMPSAGEGDRPRVLLILPPAEAPPMRPRPGQPPTGFQPVHEGRIHRAVNGGTPAIFLTSWEPPRMFGLPPEYRLGRYLREEWGVNVQAAFRVIPAAPDPNEPGKFKYEPIRFRYMPLGAFSEDHPIGRPLRGLRLVWNDLCPVTPTDAVPDGVTVTPLLAVPETWRDTWATRQLRRLARQIEEDPNSRMSPDYAAGDMPAPFIVAVTATRAKTDAREASRIVALPMAASLVDGYLKSQVPVLDRNGTLSLTDPPRSNADLVVNSVYWLIGNESLIARGPVWVRPVAMIPETTSTALWALCVIGLPLVVLGIGGTVMLLRRR